MSELKLRPILDVGLCRTWLMSEPDPLNEFGGGVWPGGFEPRKRGPPQASS